MAAPQRRPATRPPSKRPVQGRPKRARGRGAWSLKAFLVLVAVPVALMLGSVYAHTVAAGLGAEAARLKDEKAAAEAEAERLEVRVAELSESGSIRESAEKDLGMRDPGAKEIETYTNGREGEDAEDGGEESERETGE